MPLGHIGSLFVSMSCSRYSNMAVVGKGWAASGARIPTSGFVS